MAAIYIKDDTKDSPVVFDMTKVGFVKNPLVIMTTMNEVNDTIQRLKTFNSIERDNLIKSILRNIGLRYNNLDYIYKNKDGSHKEIWDDFNIDCIIYCCYRYLFNNVNLPIMSQNDIKEKGLSLFAIPLD